MPKPSKNPKKFRGPGQKEDIILTNRGGTIKNTGNELVPNPFARPIKTESKMADTTKKVLEKDRARRDAAVNNTRTGFNAGSPDKELDKDQYAKQTDRRPKR